jgi:tRNA G18 (ribose-2'-O)-methylase SpoU
LRNVIEAYQHLSVKDIQDELKQISPHHDIGVVLCGVKDDGNFGAILRTCNFFGIINVYYSGKRRYNKKPAVGTYNYTMPTYLGQNETDAIYELSYLNKPLVALENNTSNTQQLQDFVWPPSFLLVLGNEGFGLGQEMLDLASDIVEIPQGGSVPSLGVPIACGIALYDYIYKKN